MSHLIEMATVLVALSLVAIWIQAVRIPVVVTQDQREFTAEAGHSSALLNLQRFGVLAHCTKAGIALLRKQ